jgi:hypothetical protein
MEKIFVTRKDDVKVTYEGHDLSGIWAGVIADSDYVTGDYYKPGKNKPTKLASYFGGFHTTLPL